VPFPPSILVNQQRLLCCALPCLPHPPTQPPPLALWPAWHHGFGIHAQKALLAGGHGRWWGARRLGRPHPRTHPQSSQERETQLSQTDTTFLMVDVLSC